MKITAVETIQAPELMRFLWVRIHTDEGIMGIGETYVHAEAARAAIETIFAREFLLGKNPLDIQSIWKSLFDRCNYVGWAGAEIRAISAVDIALWDILGQVSGQPLWQLLGGMCRDRIPIYNTCAGEPGLDFNVNADDYACDLLASGITAMKIWPFDRFSQSSGGHAIDRNDLQKALEPIEKIRNAVGYQVDVALEFHGMWNLPCALRIASAVEQYNPMWLEDIMQVDNLDALARFSRAVKIPLVASERLYHRRQFLPLLQAGIPQYVNPDVEWCGGVTEVMKIASMADTFEIPVALHNYGGPLLNVVSAHVSAALPNVAILETGRDLIKKWNDGILAQPIIIHNGRMGLPVGSGLGNRLSNGFLSRMDLIRNVVAD